MRYDPRGQGIQLLHRYLRFSRTAFVALKVSAGGTVWSGANRRAECLGSCTGLLGRGRIIIYSFSRMLLVSYLTLESKLPSEYYRVPKQLPGGQEIAFQYRLSTTQSHRVH